MTASLGSSKRSKVVTTCSKRDGRTPTVEGSTCSAALSTPDILTHVLERVGPGPSLLIAMSVCRGWALASTLETLWGYWTRTHLAHDGPIGLELAAALGYRRYFRNRHIRMRLSFHQDLTLSSVFSTLQLAEIRFVLELKCHELETLSTTFGKPKGKVLTLFSRVFSVDEETDWLEMVSVDGVVSPVCHFQPKEEVSGAYRLPTNTPVSNLFLELRLIRVDDKRSVCCCGDTSFSYALEAESQEEDVSFLVAMEEMEQEDLGWRVDLVIDEPTQLRTLDVFFRPTVTACSPWARTKLPAIRSKQDALLWLDALDWQ